MKCTRVPVIEGTGDPMKGNAFVATKFSSGAHILHHNARSSANDKAVTPIGNVVCGNLVVQNIPTNCPQQHMRNGEELAHSINCLATQNHEHTAAPNNGHGFVPGGLSGNPQNSNEGSEFLRGLQMNKQPLVFNTPLVMCHGNRTYHEAASILANAPTMNKKSKVEGGANQGNGLPDSYVCAHAPFSQVVVQGAHPVNPVMNLSDDNKAKSDESRYGIRTDPGQRFPVAKEDVHHYNAICGLARSQWSGHKAVEYSVSTNVTYSSLGGSVQPGGKVDKFFVAGICRYFFETVHPQQSKKHFFYPTVGGSLYTYNSPHDTNTVEKSFIGANSAYKLHWSHKLCFPIVIDKHWFVFLVDLKKHLFVFMDSFFANANFLMDVSSKLINAFIECWQQYAEGYTNFDDFTASYPEVPKQSNVADCGIFAIKFMELWDKEIDLRNVFDQNDIPNVRVKLAIDMFFSEANTIDKSRVINFGQQGINPCACS